MLCKRNGMQYRIFGRRTGLQVSELALGTGNFGTGWQQLPRLIEPGFAADAILPGRIFQAQFIKWTQTHMNPSQVFAQTKQPLRQR
jgi:hypothetical protein